MARAAPAKALKIGITLPLLRIRGSVRRAGPEGRRAGHQGLQARWLHRHGVGPRPCGQRRPRPAAGRQGHDDRSSPIRPSSASSARSTRPWRRCRSRSPTRRGLFQCSPANTNPDLTKGDAGKELRAKSPDKINYVRVATTDDIQGPAVAQYGYNTLGLKSVAIIDDTETYGKGIADAFAAEWEKLGGTVVGREGAPKGTTDYTAILTKFKDAAPEAVFYGGVTSTGGGLVRKQMPQVGLGDIPYLGGDGIQDGPGTTDGSFINIAGEAAANSFSSVAAIADYPGKADFATKYKAAYNEEPGAYSASGYACAQIVLKAIETAASKGDVTREAVRAAGVDPATTFETVLGPIKFDAVGDTNQKIISLYKVDLTAADGKGDWVFDSQVDYGE